MSVSRNSVSGVGLSARWRSLPWRWRHWCPARYVPRTRRPAVRRTHTSAGLVATSARFGGTGHQPRGCCSAPCPPQAGLLILGVALIGCFLVVDRRTRKVLSRAAFGSGPLKWMYVSVGVLMAATMVDMYVPLFGQHLAAIDSGRGQGSSARCSPSGWTLSEIVERIGEPCPCGLSGWCAVSPLIMAMVFRLAALSLRHAQPGRRSSSGWSRCSSRAPAWAPHRRTCRRGSSGAVNDPVEGGAAAAAIDTVQLISGAFGTQACRSGGQHGAGWRANPPPVELRGLRRARGPRCRCHLPVRILARSSVAVPSPRYSTADYSASSSSCLTELTPSDCQASTRVARKLRCRKCHATATSRTLAAAPPVSRRIPTPLPPR